MARKKKTTKKTNTEHVEPTVVKEQIKPIIIEEEMKSSYLDYAMSVIVGRALPDVRDGLKPAHRRILYAMQTRGWTHEKPYVKSAKIVGEVIGNFHPHGDSAIYDTMVRMAQDFSLRVPLIHGHGNFGSIDGDMAAAYRYTEARLNAVSEALLADINKDTVDFVDTFDGTRKEPTVLPAAWPNLLVNGSNGIAVGMATNIPPHNLGEVVTACIKLIDNSDLSINHIMKIIPGPDFPTSGIIYGTEGIRKAYKTGKGIISLRARAEIEETKNGKEQIVITEIPYQVNKSNLLASIASLVKNKKIEGITAIRDFSNSKGIRIVIELKNSAPSYIILNNLYKHTQMQISFGIINLALVNNKPKVMNIKEILQHYIDHRKDVVIRRTKYELARAEERAHILEGLRIALDNIDAVIKLIRRSKTVEIARTGLMKNFKLTEKQASAILEMRLQRLTGLERNKIEEEYQALKKAIAEYKSILKSVAKVMGIIKKELEDILKKYNGIRRTEITGETKELSIEDVIADEEMIVTITKGGFIKRMVANVYRRQRRGGRGVQGAKVKEEDFVLVVLTATAHQNLLFFTNKGKVFYIKVHELSQEGRQARGKSLKNYLNLASGEWVTATAAIRDFNENVYFAMVTKYGVLKKISAAQFVNAKRSGIRALNLDTNDELISVCKVENKQDIFIGTAQGRALRTNAGKVRAMGRSARGVRGLRLNEGDYIIGMCTVKPKTKLFVMTEKGYGKRIDFRNFQAKGRGGKGMIYQKTNTRTGNCIALDSVADDHELMIMTNKGVVLRTNVSGISTYGRSTQGVRCVNLDDNDTVSAIAELVEEH